jgi:hypothetical protein
LQRQALQIILPRVQVAAERGEGGLLVLPVGEIRGQQGVQCSGQRQHADQHEQNLALDTGHHGR